MGGYQLRDLQGVALLHATSEAELEGICAAGLRPPMAAIPNGVALAPVERRPRAEMRTALFLSRQLYMHPPSQRDETLKR